MASRLGTVVAVILLVAGCGKKAPADRAIPVAHDDPRMNAAIAKARSTVGTFIAALKSPKINQSGFSVKIEFTDGRNREYMWLAPVSYDGRNREYMWLAPVSYDGRSFQGTVNNRPEKVAGVQLGQKATVEPSKISDWMYLENRKLVGGYTLRALRDMAPPDERANFDKSMPFVID